MPVSRQLRQFSRIARQTQGAEKFPLGVTDQQRSCGKQDHERESGEQSSAPTGERGRQQFPCIGSDSGLRGSIAVVGGRRIRRSIGHRRVNRRNDRHGRFKSIAAAGNGFDQARSIIPESSSQFAYTLYEGVVGDGQIRPDCGKELVLRNKTAGIFDEVTQHREGLWPKSNLVAIKKKAAAIQIQNIAIEAQTLRPYRRRRVGIVSGHRSVAVATPLIDGVVAWRLRRIRVNQRRQASTLRIGGQLEVEPDQSQPSLFRGLRRIIRDGIEPAASPAVFHCAAKSGSMPTSMQVDRLDRWWAGV